MNYHTFAPGPFLLFFFFFGCVACGILVPQLGIDPGPSAVRVWIPNHCSARRFPWALFKQQSSYYFLPSLSPWRTGVGRVPVLWVIHGYRDPWPTLHYYLLYRNRTLSFISLQLVSRPMIFISFPSWARNPGVLQFTGSQRIGHDLVTKIPWRRQRLPTPVFWPGESHGLYSPWGSQRVGHN